MPSRSIFVLGLALN